MTLMAAIMILKLGINIKLSTKLCLTHTCVYILGSWHEQN